MIMDSLTQYEIEAHAFHSMTGHMAPGKDSPAAMGPTDIEERNRAWIKWKETHAACIRAMMKAFTHVTGESNE